MAPSDLRPHLRPTSEPPLTFGAWLRHDPIARGLAGVPSGARVLEVGPGLGAMGARLARTLDYVAVEHDPESRAAARDRVAEAGGIVHESLDRVEGEVDVICAFEVLEHIEDDVAALGEWVVRLAPGGRMLASVPAGPERMGPWDQAAGHYRRYSAESLVALFEGAGLGEVCVERTGFPVGYATEWLRNRVAERRADSDGDLATKTQQSGRLLQTPGWAGTAVRLLSIPQRTVSGLWPSSGRGTGLVAVGVRR